MVIKTAFKPKGPNLPSKRPLGSVYEAGKYALKSYGLYEDIKQYDPGYYIERYSYKTPKRVTSYIAQKLQKRFQKKQLRFSKSTSCKFNQKYSCGDHRSY